MTHKADWVSLAEISEYCRSNKILTRESYHAAHRNKTLPPNFPSNPATMYSTTWASILWIPLDDFRTYCAENGITSYQEYRRLFADGRLPPDFPPNPRNAYNAPLEHLGWDRIDIRLHNRVSENHVRRIFERITGQVFPTSRPRWLCHEGKRLELDGFCRGLKLAFEYQGEYHYEFIAPHHRSRTLEMVQERDAVKAELCRAQNVDLVAVPYNVVDKEQFIIAALKKLDRDGLPDRLEFYDQNRAQIIENQVKQEAAQYHAYKRRIDFELTADEIGVLIGLYSTQGYESLRDLFATGLAASTPHWPADAVFDNVEALRFIEYLKYLENQGRSTERVFVRMIKRNET